MDLEEHPPDGCPHISIHDPYPDHHPDDLFHFFHLAGKASRFDPTSHPGHSLASTPVSSQPEYFPTLPSSATNVEHIFPPNIALEDILGQPPCTPAVLQERQQPLQPANFPVPGQRKQQRLSHPASIKPIPSESRTLFPDDVVITKGSLTPLPVNHPTHTRSVPKRTKSPPSTAAGTHPEKVLREMLGPEKWLQFKSCLGFNKRSKRCLNSQITNVSEHPVAGGGYADIRKGIFKGKPVAIKIVRPFASSGQRIHRDKLLQRLWREFLSWSSHSHPNIIPCLGFSYDFSPDQDVPCLISPWMSNGTALSYLDQCPEFTSRLQLITQIAHGLCYLHSGKPAIVHGDLRASNILVSDEGVACLADFGLAKILSDINVSTEVSGSLRWMSPELLRDEVSTITSASDVWSFGMTALEILTGQRPYCDVQSDLMVFGRVVNGVLPSPPSNDASITADMWTTLCKCWEPNASDRVSMSEIISDLMLL